MITLNELLKTSWTWSKLHGKEQNPFHDLLDHTYILSKIWFLLEKQNNIKILEKNTAPSTLQVCHCQLPKGCSSPQLLPSHMPSNKPGACSAVACFEVSEFGLTSHYLGFISKDQRAALFSLGFGNHNVTTGKLWSRPHCSPASWCFKPSLWDFGSSCTFRLWLLTPDSGAFWFLPHLFCFQRAAMDLVKGVEHKSLEE